MEAIAVDTGKMLQCSSSIDPICALVDLYAFGRLVMVCAKALFAPSIWPVWSSNLNKCIAHLCTLYSTCCDELDLKLRERIYVHITSSRGPLIRMIASPSDHVIRFIERPDYCKTLFLIRYSVSLRSLKITPKECHCFMFLMSGMLL